MINYIEIAGYKSIKEAKIKLGSINILIGGNGAGKSNFISFFKLLRAIYTLQLQKYIIEENSDRLLYFGKKNTRELYGKLIFNDFNSSTNNAYYYKLMPNKDGGLYIDEEGSGYNVNEENDALNYFHNDDIDESVFATLFDRRNSYLQKYIGQIRIFHFHDTSSTASLRSSCALNDNLVLQADGRNLPAFLYFLKIKHTKIYSQILQQVKDIAPYINSFILEPKRLNENEIELRWVDDGDMDSNFSAYDLSDGTLRYIALTTLLMQPTPPPVIIIDEPELGLHPIAITKLAAMMQLASASTQLIVATQSPALISNFKPEDIIVVDKSKAENQSVFNRLKSEDLKLWLEEFSLGELWERNITNGGQPFIEL
jgi:predicted ATPase